MSDDAKPVEGVVPDEAGPAAIGESCSTAKPLSIAELVRTHHQMVFRYAYRLVGSVPDAEDLTQQTFLIAQQKIAQIREPEKADRWLFAVLRSCFLKNRRRRRPASAANLGMDMESVAVEPPMDQAVDGELLQLILDELPEQHRLILTMFYFDEMPYKEIARELEVPIGTVMSRLARAKSRLRSALLDRQQT